MKHLYVLMSWPEEMDMLWIKFLSFVSVFYSANLSCSMIVHIDKTWRRTYRFQIFAFFFTFMKSSNYNIYNISIVVMEIMGQLYTEGL